MFTKPTHDLATANAIEIYQHKTLAVAAYASRHVSRSGLQDAMVTMPVKMKIRRVAYRLDDLIYRNEADMSAAISHSSTGVVTRSGRAIGCIDHGMNTRWPGAERKDLGDRIFILRKQYDCYEDEELDKYSKKNENRVKFDGAKLRAWVRSANGRVRHQAHNRRLQAEQGL